MKSSQLVFALMNLVWKFIAFHIISHEDTEHEMLITAKEVSFLDIANFSVVLRIYLQGLTLCCFLVLKDHMGPIFQEREALSPNYNSQDLLKQTKSIFAPKSYNLAHVSPPTTPVLDSPSISHFQIHRCRAKFSEFMYFKNKP
jgi:hypothetical protein